MPLHRLKLHERCIVLWTVWRLLASASSSCTASSLHAPWARRLPAPWPKSLWLRPCRRPRSRNGLDGGRAQTPLRRLLDALTQTQIQKAWAYHVHHGRPLFQLLPAACPRRPWHFDARRRWSSSLRENCSGALTRCLGTWKTATARLPPRLQRAKCPCRRESCEAPSHGRREKKRAHGPLPNGEHAWLCSRALTRDRAPPTLTLRGCGASGLRRRGVAICERLARAEKAIHLDTGTVSTPGSIR